jgi:lipopolysaccharide export system permease protein
VERSNCAQTISPSLSVKKLDLYIVKKFFFTFLSILGMFVVVAVVIDISENLDRLINGGAPLIPIIFHYYGPFCVYFGNLLSPFLVFLTIIWVTSKMAQQSEIIAILASGVGYLRLLVPFLGAALFVSISILVASHFLVPLTNRVKYQFEAEYTRGVHRYDLNVHREIGPGNLYYFRSIDESRSTGYNFAIENWKDGHLDKKITCAKAQFDSLSEGWLLTNVLVRKFLPGDRELITFQNSVDTTLAIRFTDFGQPDELVWNLQTPELTKYIEKERKKGSSTIKFLEIEKYARSSNAFSILILSFIAVVIASRKSRRGVGVHLLAAIVVAAIFIFSSRMSSVAATNVGLPAYIAVWIPNFLFFFLGLWLYVKAPK